MHQVSLVPDQCAVQQFAPAGPHPALHDSIHARQLDAAEHDRDAGVGEDGVEQGRVLAVPIPDQVLDVTPRILDVHHEVAGGLGHPSGSRVRGRAEDADPAAGVVDDREDVHPRSRQRHRLKEIRGQQRIGLGTQELRPGRAGAVRAGVDAGLAEDFPDGGCGDLDAEGE